MINIFRYKKMQNYYLNVFEEVYNGKIDTWDYQWSFTRLINYGMTIQPNVNLIQNIGFGIDATHTHKASSLIVNNFANNIDFPLSHPFFKIPNNIADIKYFTEIIYRKNIFFDILIKLMKIVKMYKLAKYVKRKIVNYFNLSGTTNL